MPIKPFRALLTGAAATALLATPLGAQDMPTAPRATYADLVDLSIAAPLVLRAKIDDQATVERERAPGLAPGHARLYVEAETTALIAGNAPIGESLRYLVDVPLDAKGKVPKLKKREVVLFARPVAGNARQVQLVYARAQLPYTPELESRLRPILTELVDPDRAPVITGVRDALSVEGTLTGESETQLFLDTRDDGPVSVTIVRRPNQAPRWGVSWSEIVDQSARAPQRETLAWYRMACFLPETLPNDANLSREMRSREMAARDYAFMIEQLGACPRNRTQG